VRKSVRSSRKPCLAAREVLGEVGRDLLDEQVVLRRVGDEDRRVLQHEVEGGRVGLVLDQLGSGDVEDLDREAQGGSELRIRAQVGGGAGEPDQRA
jgi:hypothetical protein